MFKKRQYCPVSTSYDAKHLKQVGYNCPYRHTFYHWPAKVKANHCIVGDSIIKLLKVTNQADVVSFPGINIDRLYWKIRLSGLKLSQYKIIVLHVGTNDIASFSPVDFVRKYLRLISAVKKCNESAIVAVSSILPRPRDPDQVNNQIAFINRELKKFGLQLGFSFIPSYRPFILKDKSINLNLFACDKLHLSFRGSVALRNNLIGNIKNLQGKSK